MKKYSFLFSFLIFFLKGSDNLLKDAILKHTVVRQIGGSSWMPEMSLNKFYCIKENHSEIKKYEEIQKYMVDAKIVATKDQILTEKIAFLKDYRDNLGWVAPSPEETSKAEIYNNEILEIPSWGGYLIIDNNSNEKNKFIHTCNACNCVIVGCFDEENNTRGLWHINPALACNEYLNSLDNYLKNTDKSALKIAVLSGYYSSNVLNVVNIIKNNNCKIHYADIFPLYRYDTINKNEDIFLYVNDPDFLIKEDLKSEIPCIFKGRMYHSKSLAITPGGAFVVAILYGQDNEEIKIKYLKDTYHQSLYEEIEEANKSKNNESNKSSKKITHLFPFLIIFTYLFFANFYSFLKTK